MGQWCHMNSSKPASQPNHSRFRGGGCAKTVSVQEQINRGGNRIWIWISIKSIADWCFSIVFLKTNPKDSSKTGNRHRQWAKQCVRIPCIPEKHVSRLMVDAMLVASAERGGCIKPLFSPLSCKTVWVLWTEYITKLRSNAIFVYFDWLEQFKSRQPCNAPEMHVLHLILRPAWAIIKETACTQHVKMTEVTVPLSLRSRYSAASINICTIPIAAIFNNNTDNITIRVRIEKTTVLFLHSVSAWRGLQIKRFLLFLPHSDKW